MLSGSRSFVWVFGLAALGLLSVLPGLVLAGGQLSGDGEFIVSKDQTAVKWYTFPNGSLINFTQVPVVVKAVADVKADDVFLNLWSVKGDINKAEYLFTVANPLSTEVTIKGNVFNKIERYLNISPSDVRNVSAFWYVGNYPYNRTFVSSYNCSSVTRNHSNGTSTVGEVCSPVYSTVVEPGVKLFDLGEVPFLASLKMRYMLVRVEFKAGLGRRGLDWVPSLQVGGKNLTRSDWAWYNTSWAYMQSCIVNNPSGSFIGGMVSSCKLNTASLINSGKLKSDCSDLRITADNATLLPLKVEACNAATSSLWFNSNFSNGNNTFYIYYGNPTASIVESARAVWASNYSAVYLFDNDITDSIGYYNLSTASSAGGFVNTSTGKGYVTYANATGKLFNSAFNTSRSLYHLNWLVDFNSYAQTAGRNPMVVFFGNFTAGEGLAYHTIESASSVMRSYLAGTSSPGYHNSNQTMTAPGLWRGVLDYSDDVNLLRTFGNGTQSVSASTSGLLSTSGGAGGNCLNLFYEFGGTSCSSDTTRGQVSATADYIFISNVSRSIPESVFESSYVSYAGDEIVSPLVVFVNQTPIDLNATNGIGGVNVTFNVTNKADSNNVTFYYGISPTSNTSAPFSEYYFVNGSGSGGWRKNINRVYNISAPTEAVQTWMASISDNEAYPGSYPYCPFCMINTTHTSLSVSSANEHISWLMLNISSQTGPFGFLEVMVNKSVNTPIQVRVCNASYTFSSAQDSSPNCGTVGSISNPWIPNHYHSNNSWHHVLPIAIVSNSIAGVNLTPNMWFYVEGPGAGQTVTLFGLGVAPRPGSTRSSGNGGTSWTNQTFVVDSHVHQMNASMGLAYIAEANTTFGVQNSTVVFDAYNLTAFAPTGQNIYKPIGGWYNDTVDVNWTAAVSVTGESVDYSVFLANESNLGQNFSIGSGLSALSTTFNSNLLNCSTAYNVVVMARGTTSDLRSYVYSRPLTKYCLYIDNYSNGTLNEVPLFVNFTTYLQNFTINNPFIDLNTIYMNADNYSVFGGETAPSKTNYLSLVGSIESGNLTLWHPWSNSMSTTVYYNFTATNEDSEVRNCPTKMGFKNAFVLNAFNLTNGAALTSWNVQESVGANTFVDSLINNTYYKVGSNCGSSAPFCGEATFLFTKGGFGNTYYSPYVVNKSSVTSINAFLPVLSESFYVTFQTNAQGGYTLEGVTIELYTSVNGTMTLVASLLSDAGGQARTYVVPTIPYRVLARKTGFSDVDETLTIASTPITITMGRQQSYDLYSYMPLSGITYWFSPSGTIVGGSLVNLTGSALTDPFAPIGTGINSVGMSIGWLNGTLFKTCNVTKGVNGSSDTWVSTCSFVVPFDGYLKGWFTINASGYDFTNSSSANISYIKNANFTVTKVWVLDGGVLSGYPASYRTNGSFFFQAGQTLSRDPALRIPVALMLIFMSVVVTGVISGFVGFGLGGGAVLFGIIFTCLSLFIPVIPWWGLLTVWVVIVSSIMVMRG